jgi:hypothetical protein
VSPGSATPEHVLTAVQVELALLVKRLISCRNRIYRQTGTYTLTTWERRSSAPISCGTILYSLQQNSSAAAPARRTRRQSLRTQRAAPPRPAAAPTPATVSLPAVPRHTTAEAVTALDARYPGCAAQKNERPRAAVPLRPPVMAGGSREPRQRDSAAGSHGSAGRTGSHGEAPDRLPQPNLPGYRNVPG